MSDKEIAHHAREFIRASIRCRGLVATRRALWDQCEAVTAQEDGGYVGTCAHVIQDYPGSLAKMCNACEMADIKNQALANLYRLKARHRARLVWAVKKETP